MVRKQSLVVLVLVCLAVPAHALDDGRSPGDIPAVLDYNRRAAWTTRNEIYLYGGDYFGNGLKNSWIVGSEYLFHITKHIGVGTTFGYSKADFQDTQPGFVKDDNLYLIDGTMMITFPAAYRVGRHVIETDLYMLLGAGTMRVNDLNEPHGFIGGGMKIATAIPWCSVRVDLRNFFHSLQAPSGASKFNQDLVFMVGPSFQIPPRIAP